MLSFCTNLIISFTVNVGSQHNSIFELNGDGKAEAVSETTADNRDDVLAAIDGCPVGAIREEK